MFIAVKLTVKLPALLYVCVLFFVDETTPSPKDQFQLVGKFNDVSLNITANGNTPLVIFSVKDEFGSNVPI